MGGDQNGLLAQHMWLDGVKVIGPDARAGVLQAFAARRRDVIGTAPDVNLFLTPLCAGVILVETGEIAIVALVQGLVADGFKARLAKLVENVLAGNLRAGKGGGVGNVELQAGCLEALACGLGFRMALLGEARITPAGKEVLEVPFALAMADQDEWLRDIAVLRWWEESVIYHVLSPSTSSME